MRQKMVESGTEAYNISGARYLRHLLVLAYHDFPEQKGNK